MIDHKTVYNNVNEYIAIKNMQALADKVKDTKPLKVNVLEQINEKLKIHEN